MKRHIRAYRCPVCGGADGDPRGKEKRCDGWTTDDGAWVHCSREEFAGDIAADPNGRTYAHRMQGPCRCGETHGAEVSRVQSRIEATYDYRDENGEILFQVVRYLGKEFRQRKPDGAGGWVWQLHGVRRVLYRLPELMTADPKATVYIVEGEKDVDTARAAGLVATCNPGGAGKWSFVADHARPYLEGRTVVVVADADETGRRHAIDVAKSVGAARVVEPPAPHKDLSALLQAGGRVEELVPLTTMPPSPATLLAPALPFDDIWTPEPEAKLVVPAMGLAPGPAHLVTGTWYTGKTLLLMTIGLAVASGRDLFGLWRVQKGGWTHFDYEMGRRHVKRYLQRLRRGVQVDPDELRGSMTLRVFPRLNLRTENAVDYYTELLEGQSVATFDPLRAAVPGVDENKSEFREFIDMLGIVSDRTGCAVVVLHHGGKPTAEPSARRNTGRGTSAIDDAVQSKFVLSAKEKGAPMLVTHEKTRELTKPLDDFWLEIDNSIPDAVRLVHREAEELSQDSSDGLIAKVVDIVRSKPGCSTRVLRETCRGVRGETVDAARDEAERMGLIVNRGRASAAKWHAIERDDR